MTSLARNLVAFLIFELTLLFVYAIFDQVFTTVEGNWFTTCGVLCFRCWSVLVVLVSHVAGSFSGVSWAYSNSVAITEDSHRLYCSYCNTFLIHCTYYLYSIIVSGLRGFCSSNFNVMCIRISCMRHYIHFKSLESKYEIVNKKCTSMNFTMFIRWILSLWVDLKF